MTLDALRGKKHGGFGWALAQLAVGVGAAAGALAIAERQSGDHWQGSTGRWASDTSTSRPEGAVDLTSRGEVGDHANASA